MPIHDWTRVGENRYHCFHQSWTVALSQQLNGGILPSDLFALLEPSGLSLPKSAGETDAVGYARHANRIAVRRIGEELVALVEVLSPGNKESRRSTDAAVRQAVGSIRGGIHLLIVDPFPPNTWNPRGIHNKIWNLVHDESFEPPAEKSLTLACYSCGVQIEAFVESLSVGDTIDDMPIFLGLERYVACPLESTYISAWNAFPAALKGPLLS